MRFHVDVTIEFQLVDKKSTHRIYSKTSWQRIRKTIGDRDGYLCHYCGVYAMDGTVDHVIPLSRGGDDSYTNLVWSCQACNSSKGDRSLEEWLMLANMGDDDQTLNVDEDDFAWFCQHVENGNGAREKLIHKQAPSGTKVTRGYWDKLRTKAMTLDKFGSDGNGSLKSAED